MLEEGAQIWDNALISSDGSLFLIFYHCFTHASWSRVDSEAILLWTKLAAKVSIIFNLKLSNIALILKNIYHG